MNNFIPPAELVWVQLEADDVIVGQITIRHIGKGKYQLHGGRICGRSEAVRVATLLNRMVTSKIRG